MNYTRAKPVAEASLKCSCQTKTKFSSRVSYIEIYNETVKDLLNVDKKDIKVHESLQGIKVDATEKVTSSPEEVLEAMREVWFPFTLCLFINTYNKNNICMFILYAFLNHLCNCDETVSLLVYCMFASAYS